VARSGLLLLAVAVLLLAAAPADAETYRFQAGDGTVHFTNSPTDPRYRNLGGGTPRVLALPAPPAAGLNEPGGVNAFGIEIADAARRYGVPESLISAIIRIESNFDARAVSPRGAQGLMQLMPSTASLLGVRNIFDPQQNIDGGVRHLRTLMERFGHDLPLALAAYNAGEQAVIASGGIPPYAETRDYITRVLRLYQGGGWSAADSPGVRRRSEVYRLSSPDGTTIYTNIPSRPR
jgi:soluble lytic murein transglycosylase-like protein